MIFKIKIFNKSILILLLIILLVISTNSHPIISKKSLNVTYSEMDNINDEKIIILYEGFEEGKILPNGWKLATNNSNYSWHIGNYNKHSGNYSGQCVNNPNNLTQNELLITPLLDLKGYSEIFLDFWWSLSYYWAVSPYNYYDFNVLISTDGGINWTEIWTEDSLSLFENWKWYNATLGNPIDLSGYINNDYISLAFQYYGQNGAQLNIDDIIVYATQNSNNIIVDAGGPYEAFVGENINFQGNVSGGVKPYLYSWYFGDGEKSMKKNALHKYNQVGIYDVVLNITDFSRKKSRDHTKVTILNMSKKPHLVIYNLTGTNNIKAQIKNIGDIIATNITWEIEMTGGVFKNFILKTKGQCNFINCNCSINITSDPLFYLGVAKILIFTEAENSIRSYKKAYCLIISDKILFIAEVP